jgi:hypothetical protein
MATNGTSSPLPTEKSEQDTQRNESLATSRRHSSVISRAKNNVNAKLANPLDHFTLDELRSAGSDYAKLHGITDPDDLRAFELGAILAQHPEKWSRLKGLATDDEMTVLEKEFTNRWSQPRLLYLVIVLCSTCAAVQGMGSSLISLCYPARKTYFCVPFRCESSG